MATSPISFNGLTTGIQTDKLVSAILSREGQSVQKLVDKQAYNKTKSAALQTIRKNVDELGTSLAALSSVSDKTTATALQDTVAKYNTLMKSYKDVSSSTRSSTGAIVKGSLSDTQAIKADLAQIQTSLGTDLAGLGITTGQDGSLSLNVSEFQTNYDIDPTATLSKIKAGSQVTRDLAVNLTATGYGDVSKAIQTIDTQNLALTQQIEQGQARLARRETVLKAQFSKMETTIAQMKAAIGGLTTLGTLQ